MKKYLLALTAAVMLLPGCGNTSKADDIIENNGGGQTVELTEADKSVAREAEAFAAEYWSGREVSPAPEQVNLDSVDKSNGDIDIDLTVLDSNMVYAQVFDMVNEPEKYLGQTVKAKGNFAHTVDGDTDYFAVFISDASACCAQGIEFECGGEYVYPEDYPAEDSEITVIGTFATYEDGGWTYCTLKDSELLFL